MRSESKILYTGYLERARVRDFVVGFHVIDVSRVRRV